jgi:hypothetical protein
LPQERHLGQIDMTATSGKIVHLHRDSIAHVWHAVMHTTRQVRQTVDLGGLTVVVPIVVLAGAVN